MPNKALPLLLVIFFTPNNMISSYVVSFDKEILTQVLDYYRINKTRWNNDKMLAIASPLIIFFQLV